MRRDGRMWLVAMMLVLALVAAACGDDDDDEGAGGDTTETTEAGDEQDEQEGRKGGVFRLGIVEPTSIDPYNAQNSEDIIIAKNLYDGLTEINPKTYELQPAVAEDWEKNEDCTEWTFNLKDDQRFSNGEPVDAEAFIRSWTRTVKQSAASDVAYHLAVIEGYEELHGSGEENAPPATATTFSGLSAPDPQTLVVKLSEGDCEFEKRTAHTVYSPVPESAGEADNQTYNEMPIGNGPFKMKEPWQHDKSVTLVRNDEYTGENEAFLDEVQLTILPSENAIDLEYKNFQAGQMDWARIPPALVPQAKATYEPQDKFISQLTNGINYLLPSTFNPPLNNADARKAISYAIDRDAIIRGVFQGLQTKATAIIPPPFEDAHQKGLCEACEFDLDKAKEHAQKGNLTPGTKLSLIFNTGGGHEAWVQAVAQQLRDNLGLDVSIGPMPFAELLEKESAEDFSGLARAAWGADYPTPENFLFPLLSEKSLAPTGDNRGRYVNKKFDEVLAEARSADSDDERTELIQEAERIAIADDQALIPLWYRSQYRVSATDKFNGADFMDFNEDPYLPGISEK